MRLHVLRHRETVRITNWQSLSDALLHRCSVSNQVPLVESAAKVWLATVDGASKVFSEAASGKQQHTQYVVAVAAVELI
jgi:hypothetical protein